VLCVAILSSIAALFAPNIEPLATQDGQLVAQRDDLELQSRSAA